MKNLGKFSGGLRTPGPLMAFVLGLVVGMWERTDAQTSWTKYDGNPVLDVSPGQFDGTWLTGPTVIYEDGTYKMWYMGYDGSMSRIGY